VCLTATGLVALEEALGVVVAGARVVILVGLELLAVELFEAVFLLEFWLVALLVLVSLAVLTLLPTPKSVKMLHEKATTTAIISKDNKTRVKTFVYLEYLDIRSYYSLKSICQYARTISVPINCVFLSPNNLAY
jgi:uncharacterized membrane protein required for colicin V production